MRPLAWVGIASLCLGAAWAIPAQEGSRKVEKPKVDLALYENLDLDNYDLTLDSYGDVVDLSNYEELYDYGDIAPKVRGARGSTEGRGCSEVWARAGEASQPPTQAYEPWWLFLCSCWWEGFT